MNNIAIIPARGGSKRIPRKNIRSFLGKPILAYSIDTAINSGLFNEVMVSTDDQEIAAISIQYGAKIPFLRSKDNSTDFATTRDVIEEVINNYKKNDILFDNICCIYPCAPLLCKYKIIESYDLLLKNNFDSVFPIVKYTTPIERALRLENNKVSMMNEKYLNSRSQDLDSYYYDAGQFYWLKKRVFDINKNIYNDNSGAIILSELYAQDIDNEIDWEIAKIKYKLLNNKI
jgi:pseudaminic acid cytidylyltransferase